MRKFVFISLLALVAVVFAGCEGNKPEHKETIDLVAHSNDWEFDNTTQQYYVHFNVSSLTANVYNYGEVSVSREYKSGTPDAYQVALPETTYQQVDLDNGDGSYTPYYYSQHIDYAVGIGWVEVFCTISDFYYDDFQPQSMLFRLQMTY